MIIFIIINSSITLLMCAHRKHVRKSQKFIIRNALSKKLFNFVHKKPFKYWYFMNIKFQYLSFDNIF